MTFPKRSTRHDFFRLTLLLIPLLLFCQIHTVLAQDKADKTTSENPPKASKVVKPSSEVSMKGTVTVVKGTYIQHSTNGGKTWVSLKKDSQISQNDLIRTGFGSSCEIQFADHTTVIVQPLSSLRVARFTSKDDAGQQTVRTFLNYGAVRCGVEKGRVKADTAISTPVSTLSIRGTIVAVDYDPGTRKSRLHVIKGGPAYAGLPCRIEPYHPKRRAAQAEEKIEERDLCEQYYLIEGMMTDEQLSRHLHTAILDRTIWITGNQKTGDITSAEAQSISNIDGFIDPTDGALEFGSEENKSSQSTSSESFFNFPGGDIPVGQ